MKNIENVKSSFIKEIEYDAETETLLIEIDGADYEYQKIDNETYQDFISISQAEDSFGRAFNQLIKENFEFVKK